MDYSAMEAMDGLVIDPYSSSERGHDTESCALANLRTRLKAIEHARETGKSIQQECLLLEEELTRLHSLRVNLAQQIEGRRSGEVKIYFELCKIRDWIACILQPFSTFEEVLFILQDQTAVWDTLEQAGIKSLIFFPEKEGNIFQNMQFEFFPESPWYNFNRAQKHINAFRDHFNEAELQIQLIYRTLTLAGRKPKLKLV